MSKERDLLKKMYDQFATVFPSEEEQELLDEVEELLAQPEPEPIYIVGKGWQCDVGIPKEGTKLYSAPQKREPLSDDELNEMADKYITDEACAGYFNGFRDAEKEHGIGE